MIEAVSESASNEMVPVVVPLVCELSLLVSQQNHSNLSLKPLDDTLKRLYQKKGDFQNQEMLKSVTAIVDEKLVRISHKLRQWIIHKIVDAMKVLEYMNKTFTATKWMPYQVYLSRTRPVETKWSDADK